MRVPSLLAVCLLAGPAAVAAPAPPAIPAPDDVLGFEVGARHVRHDQLVRYLEMLAAASPRVALSETGRTHEGRRLLLVAVSSPDNIANLETLRRRHLDEIESGTPAGGPLVVWQGFSVHGNEASGSNAALLFAHWLATVDGEAEARLDDTIVLIDPALNPDGLDRFAQWVNGHRGRVPAADPNDREHHEVWPGGRTNHYWFDLNRDWLPLVHPESRARVEQFHRWRPHVLTDFHEMGSDATYFFQPGVPERRHPLTPAGADDLTRRLAAYHARALDDAGELYYTEETFDDFYFGKGSTYPDINGTIGILLEQGSARGHMIETPHGRRTFRDAVLNQLRIARSTLAGADELREPLLRWQAEFQGRALDEAARDDVRAYVIGDAGDPVRAAALIDILLRHRIEVYALRDEIEADGRPFRPGHAYVVPTAQRQYRLVKALMERRTEFESETFYDVSAWTMPDAFNLPLAVLRGRNAPQTAARIDAIDAPERAFAGDRRAVAYAFDWRTYAAPRALQRLLAGEFRAYAATAPMTVATPGGEVTLGRGSIVLPLGVQARTLPAAPGTSAAAAPAVDRRAELEEALAVAARLDGVAVHAIVGGLTPGGPDLGSPTVRRVEPVRPLLVVGRGVSGYEAGEVWHLLDTRVGLPLTRVDVERLGDVDLSGSTHVVLVDGRYDKRTESWAPRLRAWVEAGGVLVTSGRAAAWATGAGLHRPRKDDGADDTQPADPGAAGEAEAEAEAPERRPYAAFRDERARRMIGGAIVRIDLDGTHPLGFGYDEATLPVFRSGTVFLEPGGDPFTTVGRYTDSPLIAGFVAPERLTELAGSAAITADRVGRGAVVRLADDANFRGMWYGTNRLFLNALYFGRLIETTGLGDQR